MTESYQAAATIHTDQAKKYLMRLGKHFAIKVPVELTETEATVDFKPGHCHLQADDGTLQIHASAASAEELARVKFIVRDHAIRFARRETLTVVWQNPSAE
ncbi:MAG: DUF2218 domain-containing protein [Opitutales bacterium]